MPKETPKSINLLEPVLAPQDAWSKVYDWVTKAGRYILVGVEIIVLGVFFARFIFDRQNNKLSDDINNKVNYILSNENLRRDEIRFRNYHILLSDIKLLSSDQKINSAKFSSIIDSIPKNFRLKNIAFTSGQVNLSMTTDNLQSIGQYTSNLNSNPMYSNVSSTINKSSGQGSEIEFAVSFALVDQESE